MTNVSNITVDLSLRQSSSDDLAFDNFTLGTPEPSTIGLALVGLAGLGLARKRVKKEVTN